MRVPYYDLYRTTISSDFVRKVVEVLITRILLIGVGLLTSVLVARALGPTDRGLYGIAFAIGLTGVQFGNLGLHASNTYFVAKDRGLLPILLSNTLVISLGAGTIGAALVYVLFALVPELAPLPKPLLALALSWVPVGLAYMLLQNLLLGIHEIRTYNKIEIITKVLTLCLIATLVGLGSSTVEHVFGASIALLVVALALATQRLYRLAQALPRPSFALFRVNIQFGMKAYLAAFFSFLVLRSDLFLVKYYLGPEQAGYYAIAVTLADMVYMLPVAASTVLFPKLSAMQDVGDSRQFTKRATILVGMITASLCIAGTLLAAPAINILYGPAYLTAAPAFIYLLPGILFLGMQTVAVQHLNSIGYPKSIVIIWLFGAVLNFILNIPAIQQYGIVGASVVSSITYFGVFILVLILIRRRR